MDDCLRSSLQGALDQLRINIRADFSEELAEFATNAELRKSGRNLVNFRASLCSRNTGSPEVRHRRKTARETLLMRRDEARHPSASSPEPASPRLRDYDVYEYEFNDDPGLIDVDSWVAGSRHDDEEEMQPLQAASEPLKQFLKDREETWNVPNTWRQSHHSLSKLIHSVQFEQCIGVLVILNSLVIGIEVATLHTPDSIPNQSILLQIFEAAFCVLFVLEWVCRLIVYNVKFFSMDGWLWNVFDTFLVFIQVLDESQVLVATLRLHVNASVFRILRVIRLIRIMRLLRVLRLFQDLRTITSSILHSAGALAWTLSLLAVLIFCNSVIFTDVVLSTGTVDGELQYYFGSLGTTSLTLFECLLGGVHWDIIVRTLYSEVSPWTGAAFCLYVVIGFFVVLNLVTGLFIEQATRSAREEKYEAMAIRLSEVFKDLADKEGVERIDETMFEMGLHTTEMQAYLDSLNVDAADARGLFDLIDLNRDGVLDIDEIVKGCLRLQGEAKALDLSLLMEHVIDMSDRSLHNVDILYNQIMKMNKLLEGEHTANNEMMQGRTEGYIKTFRRCSIDY